MTADILALAREYRARQRTVLAQGPEMDISDVVEIVAALSAADTLAAAVLALACPRHPDAGIGCRTCAIVDVATRASKAAAASPASIAARRKNMAKARKARSAKARERRKKGA